MILQVPFRFIGHLIQMGQRAKASALRVYEIFDQPIDVVEAPDAVDIDGGPGRVEFRDVRFGYGSDHDVLRDFSLDIEPGETVAIVGETASGKSTVARLLPRFYDLRGGSVSIDGIDIRQAKLDSLRRTVGVVLDDPFLFSMSVRDNIAFADPTASDESVRAAAAAAQALEFIEDLKHGFDDVLGERGYTLSGGQRQRISLARALLHDPQILVLDDATSAIDAGVEERIHSALRHAMVDRTVIVIAHRLSTIALADRVVLLEHGQVVASGTHADLLVDEPKYRELLEHFDDESDDESVAEDDDHANAAGGHTMSMAGWGGIADTGFSGVPPEVQVQVEAYMDEGPPEVAEQPPPFSHSDYDRHVFSMRHFLRPFSAALFGVFLLVALEAVLSQAGPLLLQITIDDGVRTGDRGVVVTMGVIFGLLVPVSIGVGVLKTMSAGRVGATIMAKLRVALFSHFQRLSVDYYANERPGRLLSRMTSDLEPLQQLFQQGLVQLAVQGVTLVAITIVLFVLNPLLAVITLVVVVPGTLLMSLWYRHQAQLAQIRVRDTIANVLAHLQESLAGIRIVTAHNRRERVVVEHQNEAGEYLDANDRTAFLNGVYGPGAEAMGPVSQMILLVVGGKLVLDGRVTIGS